jgi:hypothetical protein
MEGAGGAGMLESVKGSLAVLKATAAYTSWSNTLAACRWRFEELGIHPPKQPRRSSLASAFFLQLVCVHLLALP